MTRITKILLLIVFSVINMPGLKASGIISIVTNNIDWKNSFEFQELNNLVLHKGQYISPSNFQEWTLYTKSYATSESFIGVGILKKNDSVQVIRIGKIDEDNCLIEVRDIDHKFLEQDQTGFLQYIRGETSFIRLPPPLPEKSMAPSVSRQSIKRNYVDSSSKKKTGKSNNDFKRNKFKNSSNHMESSISKILNKYPNFILKQCDINNQNVDKLVEVKILIDFLGDEDQLEPFPIKIMLQKIWKRAKQIKKVFSIQMFIEKNNEKVIELEPWFKDEQKSFAELELYVIKESEDKR